MSAELPRAQLREAAEPVSRPVSPSPGETYRQLGVSLWGKGAYEREPVDGGLTKYQQLFRAQQGDIVVNKIWARNGSVAVVGDNLAGCHGSNEFPMFAPIEGRLDPRWMHWVTKTKDFWAQCDQKSQGTSGQNRIKPERFLAVEIPLPSLGEQRRIVRRIEELAAKVEEAQNLRSVSSVERGAALAAARRTFFGETAAADWIHLSRHVAQIENGKSPATEGRVAQPDEWAVLKVGAVLFGNFDEGENKALPPSFEPLERYEVKVGDFLMARANTADLVGACAIVRATRPRLMLSDKIFRFRFKATSVLVPEYLDHALKSPALRTQIVTAATGTSPTMKNISKEKVLALLIPDVPASTQRRVVTELDALQSKLDSVKALQTETAAELNAMLPAILDKAFRGEL